jgi:hypothetical protein
VTTNCLTLPVVQATPAVFTVDGRYAVALNQDGNYNSASNPAVPGTIVTVYATGLGPISPSQPDGSLIGFPLPVNTFTFGVEAIYTVGIRFGTEVDVPFEVEYAGPAPTLVAGVSQINFRIAPYASYGAIYLHMGSTFSPGFSIYVAGQSSLVEQASFRACLVYSGGPYFFSRTAKVISYPLLCRCANREEAPDEHLVVGPAGPCGAPVRSVGHHEGLHVRQGKRGCQVLWCAAARSLDGSRHP